MYISQNLIGWKLKKYIKFLETKLPQALFTSNKKTQNFSRFPITSNLYTHAWSIKYR